MKEEVVEKIFCCGHPEEGSELLHYTSDRESEEECACVYGHGGLGTLGSGCDCIRSPLGMALLDGAATAVEEGCDVSQAAL